MNTTTNATNYTSPVHQSFAHDSAHKHVSGTAPYIDDMVEPIGTLHAYLGLSTIAKGTITNLDLTRVLASDGVVGVLTLDDAPHHHDISAVGSGDEPVFADKTVSFWGQPLFAVVAKTRQQARVAARLATITYDTETHIQDIPAALATGEALVTSGMVLSRGDVAHGLASAPHVLSGSITMGGQDHFYLEGHIALAIPGEDDEMTIHSSTQHPSEVQHVVSHILNVPSNAITIIIRRMGGGFGGKETQGNLFAVIAALAARKFGHAVKIRPDRDDDMISTGKRHDFVVDYKVGYNDAGQILAVDATYNARCGYTADLSGPVTDRALFHADNAYFYPSVQLTSKPLRTNTVSNTAFRGFGGPQGMLAAERWIQDIAYALGKDPLDIRRANFYGQTERNITPYHQTVEDCIVERVVEDLALSADYQSRRQDIIAFNETSTILKRGIALTPVKFGISFTFTAYNQAGALVHIYRDGSIHLNHGGTEMGQGLHTKISQVLADCFQIDLAQIKITATTTAKVPNTSATAASSGTDLNGMAVADAAEQIKQRLIEFAITKYSVSADAVSFAANHVHINNLTFTWSEFIAQAYFGRVQLSAAGFYKTPDIHWDRATGRGQPFYYFAYGASCSEVVVDTLTGEYKVLRTDILHDVGKSLNPALDIGQIEGGFIQGMGWLTTEELWWDNKGQLRTHAPSTYKIPLASDIPETFNVELAKWSENKMLTIKRSKAVGEPPFMLAMSVHEALGMAAASVADYRYAPDLDAPATPEHMLKTITKLKSRVAENGFLP